MTSYSVTEQTNIFLAEPPRVSYLKDLENNGPPPTADKLANIQLLKPGDFMIGQAKLAYYQRFDSHQYSIYIYELLVKNTSSEILET